MKPLSLTLPASDVPLFLRILERELREDLPGWEDRLRAQIDAELVERMRRRLYPEPVGILSSPAVKLIPWEPPSDG